MRVQETELTMHEFVVAHTNSMQRWDLPASVKRSQQGLGDHPKTGQL